MWSQKPSKAPKPAPSYTPLHSMPAIKPTAESPRQICPWTENMEKLMKALDELRSGRSAEGKKCEIESEKVKENENVKEKDFVNDEQDVDPYSPDPALTELLNYALREENESEKVEERRKECEAESQHEKEGRDDEPRRDQCYGHVYDAPASDSGGTETQYSAYSYDYSSPAYRYHDENAEKQEAQNEFYEPLVSTAKAEPSAKSASLTSSQPFYESDDEDENEAGMSEVEILKHEGTTWTGRFCTITDAIRGLNPASNKKYGLALNHQLVELSRDFVLSAQNYGRIIISEVYLPDEKKTILPVDVGGVAGGAKYIVRDILFKFSLDTKGIYHSNASAAKVAGHELKGVMAYFNLHIPDLHVPMMAIVDYRGFRLVAISLLPINETTLVYGSADAGRTVKNSNPIMDEKMNQAAAKLNLKRHAIGALPSSSSNQVHLSTAADVEGHCVDGRYYLLDLARVFPPTKPDASVRAGHLFQLLRPELVRLYNKPLCSDAFSGFIRFVPDSKEMNQEAIKATEFMLNVQVPRFAKVLVALLSAKYHFAFQTTLKPKLKEAQQKHREKIKEKGANISVEEMKRMEERKKEVARAETWRLYQVDMLLKDFQLKQFLHARGINMRYLGVVKKHIDEMLEKGKALPSKDLDATWDAKKLVFIEICARTIRKILDAKLRKRMRDLKVPLEEPYRRLVVDYLNRVFSQSGESKKYWSIGLKKKILKKFGNESLTIEEASPDFCLKDLLVTKSRKAAEDDTQGQQQPQQPQQPQQAQQGAKGLKESGGLLKSKWSDWYSNKEKKNKRNSQSQEREKEENEEKKEKEKEEGKQEKGGYNQNGRLLLLHRVKELTGIVFTTQFEEAVRTNRHMWASSEIFSTLDIASVGERVKHLGLMHHAMGYIFKLEAFKVITEQPKKAIILLQEALKEFEKVLESNPTNKVSLRNCAQVLLQLDELRAFPYPEGYWDSKTKARLRDINRPAVQQAMEYMVRAIQSDPTDTHSLYQIGMLYVELDRLQEALEFMWRALLADLNHEIAWVRVASLMRMQGYEQEAQKVNTAHDMARAFLKWEA